MSILSFDNTNARNYHAGPRLRSIARNYDRSPATPVEHTTY
ncbi:hypothetical protein [Microcoleus sp. MON2_D5]